MYGVRKNTTISREIEDLDDFGNCRVDNIRLNQRETLIEFPGVVCREWRAKSDERYFRLDERDSSYRECQVTAEEEVLHG